MPRVYDTLSHEGKVLLDQAMDHLDPFYDAASGLLCVQGYDGRQVHTVRSSAHYALGLLVRGGEGDLERACRVIDAVIATQLDFPGEVYHGTFRRATEEPTPPVGTLPWQDITILSRYHMDLFSERIFSTFHTRLNADAQTAPLAKQIETMLQQSVLAEYPVVWKSYDPNWREFILCAFALALEYCEKELPVDLVARMDACARRALDGAIARSSTNFSPLNTNIEIMHVFVIDYFAGRLNDVAAAQYALDFAEKLATKYFEFHSVNEFNSPTYCGVDLTAIRFWQQYATHPRIRALGAEIEAGLWEDIADFYNPAMQNICGPFSRNYEMDMSQHTAMHALLYMGLGEERFPNHPFTTESDHNPLLALSGVEIPTALADRFLHSTGERTVTRKFRELSERGDPRNNAALCTARAWITDDLMCGALSGSENVSGQLHPATAYWRDAKGGVSSMRLRRATTDGHMDALHTVYFDCALEKNVMSIDIRSCVNRDIEFFFEFESSDLENASITPDKWTISNLDVAVKAQAPGLSVKRDGQHMKICYAARYKEPETMKMHFDLVFSRREG